MNTRTYENNSPSEDGDQLSGAMDAILDSVQEGIVWADGSCRIRAMSRSLAVLLGISRGAASGAPCREIIRCRDAGGNELCEGPFGCGRLLGETGLPPAPVTVMLRAAGEERVMESVAYLLPGAGDRSGGVIRVFRPSSGMSADPGKDALRTHLSHELRTPLTAVRGYLELLLAGDAGRMSGLQREFLLTVSRNMDQLAQFIDTFLAEEIDTLWSGSETRSQE